MLVALEILALALLKKTLLRDPSLKPIPQSDIHPLLKYLSTVVPKVMCFLDHPDAATIVLLSERLGEFKGERYCVYAFVCMVALITPLCTNTTPSLSVPSSPCEK